MSAKKNKSAKAQKKNAAKVQKANSMLEDAPTPISEVPDAPEAPVTQEDSPTLAPETHEDVEAPAATESTAMPTPEAHDVTEAIDKPQDVTMTPSETKAFNEIPATAEAPTATLEPNGAIEIPATAEDATTPAPEAQTADQAPAKKAHKPKAEPKPKKVSALDAAAKVLAENGKPMNCMEMVEEMSRKGYWSSPNGATPQATLYSAILREIKVKGVDSRFVKAERDKFAAK